jgi:hypothetical protein
MDLNIKRCYVRLYLQLFVGGLMSYLHYFCLFAYNGVQHILCCSFALFFFVVLPVSLDCPFLIAPSVFSNVCSLEILVYVDLFYWYQFITCKDTISLNFEKSWNFQWFTQFFFINFKYSNINSEIKESDR